MSNMGCKYCGSESVVKNGSVAGKQVYKCKDCGHRFYDNGKFSRMKTDKRTIVAALNLYYDGLSVRKAQKQLETILGEKVTEVSIWNWLQKYSKLVGEYVQTLAPQLSGKWHEDETMIKCEGRDQWFWEMIDEETRFLVASHLSGERNIVETIKVFRKAQAVAKQRPKAIFVDGSQTYDRAFNKVYYSRYKANRVVLVKRVGIKARETNNIVERLHGTLKDRLKPMRGLKNVETAKALLEGYVVNYNYVREHQSIGMTPAQAAGVGVTGWKELIEKATANQAKPIEVKAYPIEQAKIEAQPIAQVVRAR